jgi:hypothetical protein
MCHNQSKDQSMLIIPALRQLASDGFRALQETIGSRLECERSAKEVSFVLHLWHPEPCAYPSHGFRLKPALYQHELSKNEGRSIQLNLNTRDLTFGLKSEAIYDWVWLYDDHGASCGPKLQPYSKVSQTRALWHSTPRLWSLSTRKGKSIQWMLVVSKRHGWFDNLGCMCLSLLL